MQQEKKVTLQLSINEINIVMAGIVKLPIEVGLETFKNVQQQVDQQIGGINGPLANKVVN